MGITKKKLLVIISLALFICNMLLTATACEPCIDVKVENGTDQVLTIYLSRGSNISARQGSVKPGEYLELQCLEAMFGNFTITAKNELDGEIYTRKFDYIELKDDYKCKVVIKLSEEE